MAFAAQQFPSAAYETDGFWTSGVEDFFALLIVVSFLYPLSGAVKALVWEKEAKVCGGRTEKGKRRRMGGNLHSTLRAFDSTTVSSWSRGARARERAREIHSTARHREES